MALAPRRLRDRGFAAQREGAVLEEAIINRTIEDAFYDVRLTDRDTSGAT